MTAFDDGLARCDAVKILVLTDMLMCIIHISISVRR